jgi:CBS domain containing-hemolysin-like protein
LHFQTSDQYETLGGYIVHHTENIPEQGAIFAIEQCDFEIAEVSNTKIELVRVKLQNA